MSSPATTITIGRIDSRYTVRLSGKGTWRESCCCQQLAAQCLESSDASLVIDLSACEYLDSTFLGCLVELRRKFGKTEPPRVALIADDEHRAQLFGHSRVDTILKFIDPSRETPPQWTKVPVAQSSDAAQHIMQCHKALAELGGEQHTTFAKIAERMSQEMGQPQGS
jgi:anti-anti-sigma regulatory factor